MSAPASHRRLSVPDLEAILAVTSKLAAPFDLMTMLAEVVNAADELVLEIATGIAPVRVPASVGVQRAPREDDITLVLVKREARG
jgi:hypothetical protein